MDSQTLDFLHIPYRFLDHLPMVWTFLLLVVRYTAMLTVMPGIGLGNSGAIVRAPAAVVMSFASIMGSKQALMPDNMVILIVSAACECMLGLMLGLIPLIIVSGVQTAANLASTSMGFGAGQLIDPTSGNSVADLSLLMGNLAIVIFLMLNGHHVMIHAASGMNGQIVPGLFRPGEMTIELIVSMCGEIFKVGCSLAAPVVVALSLTQFVMGMISKAVPTVNIFIISAPLTIGIGVILTILSLPESTHIIAHLFTALEGSVDVLAREAGGHP